MPTGLWPIAEDTPVGAFRVDIGDSVPTVTPTPGDTTAEFEFFSDTYIEGLLAKYADDEDEAVARALDTMSRRLMIEAEDIQVDDIRIKTVERAKLFSDHASQIRANGLVRGGEGFIVTAMRTVQSASPYTPQGTPDPYPEVG